MIKKISDDFLDLRNLFVENSSPVASFFNKKALDVLFRHISKNDLNLLRSKFKNLKNNVNLENWFSLFSEIYVYYLLSKNLKKLDDKISFSKKNDNDIYVKTNGREFFIEVKALVLNKFQIELWNFFKEIKKIPTGKKISIDIKEIINKKNRKMIFDKIINKLNDLNANYSDNSFEIKILGTGKQGETIFIGPTISCEINSTEFISFLKEKKLNKVKQINKASIVCFYSLLYTYDVEDFVDVISEISGKLSFLKEKKFLIITPWGSGFIYMNINNKWFFESDIKKIFEV